MKRLKFVKGNNQTSSAKCGRNFRFLLTCVFSPLLLIVLVARTYSYLKNSERSGLDYPTPLNVIKVNHENQLSSMVKTKRLKRATTILGEEGVNTTYIAQNKHVKPFNVTAATTQTFLGSETELAEKSFKVLNSINDLKNKIKTLRASKVIMSRDTTALELISDLQYLTRCYILSRYGSGPFIIEMVLQFPNVMMSSIVALQRSNGTETISFELAPIDYLPHAVYTILEIVSSFKKGAFHRNAAHVLQSTITSDFHGGVVFMEYDRRYPHAKHTLGFAGRGGGNAFYINTVNNTMNHGPGTDRGGKDPEADTNFGKITKGHQVVNIMQKQPLGDGKPSPNGFVNDERNYIRINSLRLIKPSPGKLKRVRATVDIDDCLHTNVRIRNQ